jgi:flagellar biosynthetic protein FlhB
MAEDTGQERTHEASERQIERFREQGRVATSRELIAAISLTTGFFALWQASAALFDALGAVARQSHAHLGDRELPVNAVVALGLTVMGQVGPPLVAALAVGAATSLVTGLVLSGGNISAGALVPKWERLDVLANFQQAYVSWKPVFGFGKSLGVALAMGWAVWSSVSEHLDAVPVLAARPVVGQLAFLGELTFDVLQRAVPVALAIGAADYLYARWELSKQMRMTTEEVKRDQKEAEGDPQLRQRRRQRQKQIAFGQMLGKVRRADVVIANPTHFAVAVRYRKEEGAAPVVLARGVDHLALKIRAEAAAHEVPVIENRPLARALYAASKVGFPIPKEFYGPVAQLLAMVYRRRGQRAGAAAGS